MNDKQNDKFEERIRFIARHYEEGRLDLENVWKQFAASHGIRKTVPFRRYLMAVASISLLLIGVGSLLIWHRTTPEWIIVSTVSGQVKDVYLPDSSYVSLAENSFIRYDVKKYGIERRELEMAGKVYFEIERNENRPFSVRSLLSEITVLGTSFQINERQNSVEVNVFTGKVSFTALPVNSSIILTGGMSASYYVGENEMEVDSEMNENALSWKTKQLRFHETSVEKVIADLSEYYNVVVMNKTPAVSNLKLTASFNDMPLDEVLLVINQTLDINLVIGSE